MTVNEMVDLWHFTFLLHSFVYQLNFLIFMGLKLCEVKLKVKT